jgi:EAL domain-containing protein (putative c-di-GMP-specific phosphodiesterase class I)
VYRAKEARNRWQVHYQPIVCLKTHRVTGVEALIRWTHPDAGPVPASQIVKLAEDSGLVIALGGFVLETDCQDCALCGRTVVSSP